MFKKLFWFCLILSAIAVGWVMLVEGHGGAFCWRSYPIGWPGGALEGIVEIIVGGVVLFLTAIILAFVLASVGSVQERHSLQFFPQGGHHGGCYSGDR